MGQEVWAGSRSPNRAHLVGFQVPQQAAPWGRRSGWVLDPPVGHIWLGSKYLNRQLRGVGGLGGF